jgi:hypothetical protein
LLSIWISGFEVRLADLNNGSIIVETSLLILDKRSPKLSTNAPLEIFKALSITAE